MRRRLFAIALMALPALGCGHSEESYRAQLGRYDKLKASCASHDTELEDEIAIQRVRVGELEQQLHAAGVDLEAKSTQVSKLSSTLEEREQALAEFRARARRLEQVKQRYDLLRVKLDDLVKLGLGVTVRHNRMVISLPGDVLFDSGKDTLRKQGEEILAKIAGVIRADKSLADRDYQVAGHTDDQPLRGGKFHDNWGLSLMRARSVLLFLVGKGGGLPRQRLSAAGFADTDPVIANVTKEGQQKNRRCDLVVMPDVDEMLDLQALAR